ncbi:vacuolar sorting protein 39 domain 2 domain-containing protein [Cordyceps javanica]|nr:vacuolar sorting protein 39 domain 2 domain-containing protein [Cordyceps javanica]
MFGIAAPRVFFPSRQGKGISFVTKITPASRLRPSVYIAEARTSIRHTILALELGCCHCQKKVNEMEVVRSHEGTLFHSSCAREIWLSRKAP